MCDPDFTEDTIAWEKSAPAGQWFAIGDRSISCVVASGSVCFSVRSNSDVERPYSCEARFSSPAKTDIPEGTWAGHIDVNEQCIVSKVEILSDSDVTSEEEEQTRCLSS